MQRNGLAERQDAEPAADETSTPALSILARSASARAQVAEALRGAIITGAMKPGELYSAPVLAEQFGVSATPVREAMVDMVAEGLVQAVRNRGFRVTEPTDAELDDMAEVRLLIEVPTVARIAEGFRAESRGAIEGLRGTAGEIVDCAESGDLIGYVEADRRFHLGLLTLAGNEHLVKVVGDLRARSRLYGLAEMQASGALGISAAEHHTLLDLVEAGDAPGAADLMRRHIGHVRGVWAGRTEP
jgi:DNA-binding GntR family transcriptional regulator